MNLNLEQKAVAEKAMLYATVKILPTERTMAFASYIYGSMSSLKQKKFYEGSKAIHRIRSRRLYLQLGIGSIDELSANFCLSFN